MVFFSDAPYFGGAEEYILLLAKALRRELFDPVVLLRDGARRIDEFEERLARSGIAFRRHRFHKEPTIRDIFDLYGILRKEKPDIFHINLPSSYDAGAGLVAVIGKLARAGAIVLTEHLPSSSRCLRLYPMKKMSLLLADRVIAICEATRDGLIRQHGARPERTVTIYNGVEVDNLPGRDEIRTIRQEIRIDEDSPLIAMIGELSPRKGHIYLLNSLVKVVKEKPDVNLAVIGEGELFPFLMQTSKKFGIEKNVKFLGRRKDVRRLIGAIDFLALPSLHEGIPYVVLETMANGKPVVATSLPGVAEVVCDGRTGFLVQPRDVDGLSAAILKLVRDREKTRKMGELARLSITEKFSLQHSVTRTEELYLEILNSKGRPAGAG
ncbi:MAG: glycosyltransferase family 4 protein [Candidatus Eisenbacteria bacterium]|nr:glycosyltransferase family 4 protein [Candidatus Eisenbacteria bacterium]